ncbi:peptidase family M48-domain-containing protein [Halteromyces radiatus]|uniref:peptidase family M48-domain-containing protein n=1 Tax=Halteromyces radiatus TaxID=101107 RepID=UPI00221EE2CA|nr:peptidase family M48-domain-containing protein [Halteromyces radiatus]KAI8076361.1 peptidase family M48-domain-containing protein [Halteromyces radiatus]
MFLSRFTSSLPRQRTTFSFTTCHDCLQRPSRYQQRLTTFRIQTFHSSRPQPSPILPLPAILLGLLKSGKLVSFVSLSSKTSLTLLPHTFRRDKGKLVGKILAGIPLFGLTLLLAVGLDQAPNTSRLRFIYLTEEEEQEEVEKAIKELMTPHMALVASRESQPVLWLQTIVDNLSKVASDDIRDPVRQYNHLEIAAKDEALKKYEVNLICDGNTLNAMCAGRYIVVYDLMMQAMEYDETKMAVILSHEMAHSVQRHFVETHGFASLLLMLGDITRGVFWMVTESFGPYVNQKINEAITAFIALESENTYNRQLEREADLVGLKFLAKAGYDPRVAIEVWTRMAEIEERVKELQEDDIKALEKQQSSIQGQNSVGAMMENLINLWFGSSHPPSQERVEYMQEHMDEAVALYEDTLRLNGKPDHFDWNPYSTEEEKTTKNSYFWDLWSSFIHSIKN